MTVRFTKTALRQIEEALSYLRERSPQASLRLAERVMTTAKLLQDHPKAAQATSRVGIRRAVLSPFPYALFYRVVASDIIVMRLRHLAQRPLP